MQFIAENTEELIFVSKRVKPQDPPLVLGSNEIARKTEHIHLDTILDEKLNFKIHIREAIIKFLSRYVSREVLDQIYKFFIRPILIMVTSFTTKMTHK